MKTTNICKTSLLLILLIWAANVSAQTFEWATGFGGDGIDVPKDLAVDPSGNSYVIGEFNSVSASIGGTTLTGPGNFSQSEVFIAKYNGAGVGQWAVGFQGADTDAASAIDLDSDNNIYATGTFNEDIMVGDSLFNAINGNTQDIFIAKYDDAGNFLWARQVSSTLRLEVFDLKVHTNGDFYICGTFTNAVSFGGNVFNGTGNNANVFLAKYKSDGSFVWADIINGTSGGGQSSRQEGRRLAISNTGAKVFMGGWFSGTVTWNNSAPSRVTLTDFGGDENHFLASYDSSGTVDWVEQIGAYQINFNSQGDIEGITVQRDGDVIVGGSLGGALIFDMNDTIETDSTINPNSWHYEGFVANYDAAGNYQWVTAVVGDGARVFDVAVDSRDHIFALGISEGPTDFNPIVAGIPTAAPYIAEFDEDGTGLSVKTAAAGSIGTPIAIEVDGNDEVYATGDYLSSIELPPHTLTSTALRNGWITKCGEATGLINLTENTFDMSVYPNPASDEVRLKLSNAEEIEQLNIYNTLGEIVLTLPAPGSNPSFNVRFFEAGLYLVEVVGQRGTSSERLIINH